ncbi:MAG TPA: hypothetical protein VGC78_13490 [Gaiellaceae bacterium]|jgi:hypothetical protein
MRLHGEQTLGDLERQGKLGTALSRLYLRLLGAQWRDVPVRTAYETVEWERRRHEDGVDLRRSRGRNVA